MLHTYSIENKGLQKMHLCSPPVLVGSVLLIFFVFCVMLVFVLCLVYPMLSMSLDCLRPVSCVPNVADVSGLSILYYSFGFL